MYNYIIKADHRMALPIKSDKHFDQFDEWFRKNKVEEIHPRGKDTIFRYGSLEFINPKVMMVSDFANSGCTIW